MVLEQILTSPLDVPSIGIDILHIPIYSSTDSDAIAHPPETSHTASYFFHLAAGIIGRLNQNRWSNKTGIGGRITPEYAG
jgi:hypothetical protein